MPTSKRPTSCVLVLLCAAVAACRTGPAQNAARVGEDDTPKRARIAVSRTLPRLNGNSLKATVVEVSYGPGAASSPHRHPCPVIGYVVTGSLRTQVKGEPEAIYQAGESFFEGPEDVHLVSANASSTKPVTFLAYFTCDHDTTLSVPVSDPGAAGGEH